MSSYNQSQGYPSGEPQGGGHMVPPPPPGYPTKYGEVQAPAPANTTQTTQSRGDGFWKGCCAALCCCCVLDACL